MIETQGSLGAKLPASLTQLAHEQNMPIKYGLAQQSAALYDSQGTLRKGLYIASSTDLADKIATSSHRKNLLQRAASGLDYMNKTHNLEWVVGGGSLFSSLKAAPNDADLLAITEGTKIDTSKTQYFNRIWGSDTRQAAKFPANLYPAEALRNGSFGANMFKLFSTTKEGTPAGLVAFRVADLMNAVKLL